MTKAPKAAIKAATKSRSKGTPKQDGFKAPTKQKVGGRRAGPTTLTYARQMLKLQDTRLDLLNRKLIAEQEAAHVWRNQANRLSADRDTQADTIAGYQAKVDTIEALTFKLDVSKAACVELDLQVMHHTKKHSDLLTKYHGLETKNKKLVETVEGLTARVEALDTSRMSAISARTASEGRAEGLATALERLGEGLIRGIS